VILLEEVMILVKNMVRNATVNMGNMRGQVLRLLEMRGQAELSGMADTTTKGRTDYTNSSRGQMELLSQPSDGQQAPTCKSSVRGIRKADNNM
jgi:hypothetical protein